jgi:hypothetical protein
MARYLPFEQFLVAGPVFADGPIFDSGFLGPDGTGRTVNNTFRAKDDSLLEALVDILTPMASRVWAEKNQGNK